MFSPQAAREARSEAKLTEGKATWDPSTDPNAADSDAFKTLFVGRINHEISESQLQRKFETYGAALSFPAPPFLLAELPRCSLPPPPSGCCC